MTPNGFTKPSGAKRKHGNAVLRRMSPVSDAAGEPVLVSAHSSLLNSIIAKWMPGRGSRPL